MPFHHITRSASALLAHYGQAPAPSPVRDDGPPQSRAGEVLLTPGQKVALLRMRGSDAAKAIVEKLKVLGLGDCTGRDYVACAQLGLAINKGSFHVLSPQGRFTADRIAMEAARAAHMHVVSYHLGSSGSAARAWCTCGWSTYRSRHVKSYLTLIAADAARHRVKQGVGSVDDAAIARVIVEPEPQAPE